jgi:hypothetical protein
VAIERGTLATVAVRARDGIENELSLQTQITISSDGRIIGQQVRLNYDGAFRELIAMVLDDLRTNVTNSTFRTQLASARTQMGL